MQNDLKIQEGKRYVLRNGETTDTIQKQENGTNYKFCSRSKNNIVLCWLKSGKYLTENTEHEKDIVKEFEMFTISEKEYNNKPEDYKSVYDSDEIHGTNLNGKRTLLTWLEGKGTVLLIEGESLIITK